MTGRFVDMSSWQPPPDKINWPDYIAWSRQDDGIARVSLRAVEYLGKPDVSYQAYMHGFLASGGDIVIHYGYVYPQRNGAFSEADYLAKVVGSLDARPNDELMCDLEAPGGTAQWAYAWLARQSQNYGGRVPTLYASDAYIREHLQGVPGLAQFDLTLADWQFTPSERPPAPPPWKAYKFLQYTDRGTVPGIPASVDVDLFLGKEVPMVQPASGFTAEDVAIWGAVNPAIPHDTGIAKDWLAHRRAGRELGPALGKEFGDTLKARQVCAGAIATWEHATHRCSWVDARGTI